MTIRTKGKFRELKVTEKTGKDQSEVGAAGAAERSRKQPLESPGVAAWRSLVAPVEPSGRFPVLEKHGS